MKKLFISIVLTVCFFAVHTNVQAKTPKDDSVAYRKVLTELITLQNAPQNYESLVDQMFVTMNMPEGMRIAMKEKVLPVVYNKIIEISIPAYEKHLSIEDLRASIKFYKTPAGKRTLEAQPLVMSEIVSHFGEILTEITPIMQEVMEEYRSGGKTGEVIY